jgi:hypothetical protein
MNASFDTAFNAIFKDDPARVDPPRLNGIDHKQWSGIPLDEQADIVSDWLWTQPDHRTLCEEGITELGAGCSFLDYMARVMVNRMQNKGWVL